MNSKSQDRDYDPVRGFLQMICPMPDCFGMIDLTRKRVSDQRKKKDWLVVMPHCGCAENKERHELYALTDKIRVAVRPEINEISSHLEQKGFVQPVWDVSDSDNWIEPGQPVDSEEEKAARERMRSVPGLRWDEVLISIQVSPKEWTIESSLEKAIKVCSSERIGRDRLKGKLRKFGIPEELIEKTLEELRRMNYVVAETFGL